MRRVLVVVVLVLIGVCVGTFAQEDLSERIEDALSSRWIGLGCEVYPNLRADVTVSSRCWFTSRLGACADVSFESWEYEGSQMYELGVVIRHLYRVMQGATSSFYTAAGVNVSYATAGAELFRGYEGVRADLLLSGGIEWSMRHASAIVWNIEFGIARQFGGGLFTTFGAGVHYYFPKRQDSASDE